MYMPKQLKLEQVSARIRPAGVVGRSPRGTGRAVPTVPSASSVAATVAMCAALMTLAGCMTPPAVAPVVLRAPSSVGVPPAVVAPPIAADWWIGFGDARLTQLIDTALSGTPSLKVVQARLAVAQAGVDAARADAGPSLGANAGATRQRFSANGLVPGALAGATRWVGSAQAVASWEIDFFGRHEAALQAALGTEQAAAAEVQAARVLLSSDIARAYVRLATLLEQRALAQRTLAQREAVLTLVRQRVAAGLDTALELRQAEGALPAVRRQMEALDGQAQQGRHALAALTAQPPESLAGLAPRLADLRIVEVPEVLPADLLARRADIHAARWRVEAAVQDVASARADFHPNVNLSALVGLSSLGLDRLLRAGSRQYSVGPAVHLPIFDAGRLRARLSGRTAELDGAIESYHQTMVDAVRDVVDQVSQLQSVARQRAEQAAALRSARSALDVSNERHRAGLVTRLSVLAGESAVLEQQGIGLDLEARAMDARLALIRALGGGYAASAVPSSPVPAAAPAAVSVPSGAFSSPATRTPPATVAPPGAPARHEPAMSSSNGYAA